MALSVQNLFDLVHCTEGRGGFVQISEPEKSNPKSNHHQDEADTCLKNKSGYRGSVSIHNSINLSVHFNVNY